MAEEIIELLSDEDDSVLVLEDDSVLVLENPNDMDVDSDDSIIEVFDGQPPPPEEDFPLLNAVQGPPPNGIPTLFGHGAYNVNANLFSFVILDKPNTWKRPKFITRILGGRLKRNVVNANKAATQRFRDLLIFDIGDQYHITDDEFPILGHAPVSMEVHFGMPVPNYMFQGGDRFKPLREGLHDLYHTPYVKTPDLDNMIKFVKDALQGIFYKDDKQVVRIVCTKSYDWHPPHEGRTVIKIRQAGPVDMPYAAALALEM